MKKKKANVWLESLKKAVLLSLLLTISWASFESILSRSYDWIALYSILVFIYYLFFTYISVRISYSNKPIVEFFIIVILGLGLVIFNILLSLLTSIVNFFMVAVFYLIIIKSKKTKLLNLKLFRLVSLIYIAFFMFTLALFFLVPLDYCGYWSFGGTLEDCKCFGYKLSGFDGTSLLMAAMVDASQTHCKGAILEKYCFNPKTHQRIDCNETWYKR